MTDKIDKFKPWDKQPAPGSYAAGVAATHADALSENLNKITMHLEMGINEVRKSAFENSISSGEISNPELDGAYVVIPELKRHEGSYMQSLEWLQKAYDIANKYPQAKIVLASFCMYRGTLEMMAKKQQKDGILTVLKANPNVKFIQLPSPSERRNKLSFAPGATEREACRNIWLNFDTGVESKSDDEHWIKAFEDAKTEGRLTNRELDGAHLILCERRDEQWLRTSLSWLDVAYELMQKDPKAKIIIPTTFKVPDSIEAAAERQNKKDIFTLLSSNPHIKFIQMTKPIVAFFNDINAISFSDELKFDSLHFGKNAQFVKSMLKGLIDKKVVINSELNDAHIIVPDGIDEGDENPFFSLAEATELLNSNPKTKIIITSTLMDVIEKSAEQAKQTDELKLLQSSPNVRFIDLAGELTQWDEISFKWDKKDSKVTNEEILDATYNITKSHLFIIRHSLQSQKVKDPYHPADEREQRYVDEAFELTKKYFPGLDTVTKMLDYVMHIPVDIPEPMKWKRIEGAYVDVDGTLIEYVPIGSDKEGKQELRPEVVGLLKKYEQEWKEIIIWTGWDVKKKEKRLRELGITWPVVSKYDYAGATAEIVVDDTDKGAFVMQSKILPETYIDTTKLTA